MTPSNCQHEVLMNPPHTAYLCTSTCLLSHTHTIDTTLYVNDFMTVLGKDGTMGLMRSICEFVCACVCACARYQTEEVGRDRDIEDVGFKDILNAKYVTGVGSTFYGKDCFT